MEDQNAAAVLQSVVRFGSVMDGPHRLAWQLRGSYSALESIYDLCAASCTLIIVLLLASNTLQTKNIGRACRSVAVFDVGGSFLQRGFKLDDLVNSVVKQQSFAFMHHLCPALDLSSWVRAARSLQPKTQRSGWRSCRRFHLMLWSSEK